MEERKTLLSVKDLEVKDGTVIPKTIISPKAATKQPTIFPNNTHCIRPNTNKIKQTIDTNTDVEKLSKKLHIPLTYNQMLFIGVFCIVLMGATYILRAKLSGKL